MSTSARIVTNEGDICALGEYSTLLTTPNIVAGLGAEGGLAMLATADVVRSRRYTPL
jgi:hypothetical protein